MGMNIRLSASVNGTRNLGPLNMGGGANLVQRSLFATSTPNLSYSQWYTPGSGSPALSTTDYYQMNGFWRSRPFDLDTAGSEGATIKAREGKRYVWVLGPDHPADPGFQASGDFYVGYSDDPQILPDPTTLRMLRREQSGINVTDEFGFSQTNFNVYHWPYLVYNPDSAGDKFWIYAEASGSGSTRQHQTGLFTTSDFLTTTLVGPVIATTFTGGWTSLGYFHRTGVNTWVGYSFGKRDGSAVNNVYYKYTSTDGLSWTEDYSTVLAGAGDYTTISGQKYLLAKEGRSDNDYISFLAVNSSNVSQGTYTRISSAFGPSVGTNSHYPGPTYLQDVWGYEEDGVLTIYASRGFHSAGPQYVLRTGPYLGYNPTFFDTVGSCSGTTLTITSNPSGLAILPGFLITAGGAARNLTVVSDDGGGNYTLSGSATVAAGTTIQFCRNGGLWNQFIDLYYYVTDATAAAGAAPLGVTADCVSGTVTISWNDCLPNRTYRVYRGTTAGTQATLIGDVTGVSITDTPTAGSQYFYKVVTMNSGVEQKSRVVSVYCSNNSQMVNRHVNRVINDGGDSSKIDMTFLASVDSYLSSNDYYKYLMHWVDVRFGVKESGGFITKVYCLGTTRLPKGGDYTPTTSNTFPSTSSNTSYSATSFRGTTPSWVNNASTARGYFANGRANNIQRKNELTLIAAYQKPGTAIATLFGLNQFSNGLYLQHASGASGDVSFVMYQSGSPITATVAFASATAAHVAAGVFDGSNLTAYLDGVAGTSVDASAAANPTLVNDAVLRGQYGSLSSTAPVLMSGTRTGLQTLANRTYTGLDAQALFTGAGLIVFEKGLSSTAIGQIGALYA